MPRGYVSIQNKDTRVTYCSADTYRNHALAAGWVARCMAHLGMPASAFKQPKYPLDSQPGGAQIVDV